jgi:hypothetical protein
MRAALRSGSSQEVPSPPSCAELHRLRIGPPSHAAPPYQVRRPTTQSHPPHHAVAIHTARWREGTCEASSRVQLCELRR